jgi:hypothetical protein
MVELHGPDFSLILNHVTKYPVIRLVYVLVGR